VIFALRRQSALQHMMYKALFELSPTRSEFVARLFSRPRVATLPSEIGVRALFDSAMASSPSDSAYNANLTAIVDLLMSKHGFFLPKDDLATIEHVYSVFYSAGPEVNYGYRAGSPASVRSTYPTFAMLQSATNADSVETAFLATEANYQVVRLMQLRNLIVPVVGNFGGPSAIKSVANWLKDRDMTVTAFYVSNVEQYLFRETGMSEAFYANVSSLPIDTTSRFIRSVPRPPGMAPVVFGVGRGSFQPGSYRFITRDSNGNTVTQTYRDSAGISTLVQVQTAVDTSRRDTLATRRLADSTRRDTLGTVLQVLQDSLKRGRTVEFRIQKDSITIPRDTSVAGILKARRDSIARANSTWQIAAGPNMAVVMGGLLTSGTASIKRTLDAFILGELKDYNVVIEMTKVGPGK
jgi:hypothetical protein